MAWSFPGPQRVGKGVINDADKLFDLLERNIPKPRLTPMAGFFVKEMLQRAQEQTS